MIGIDWLYIAELYAIIFFSIVTISLALMFGASLLFWALYPLRLSTSGE